MKIYLIYNPQAGNGRAAKLLPRIKQYLNEKNIKFDIAITQYQGHATTLAQQAMLTQYDALIASGGDGTLFEVLNGYQQNSTQNKPPMGLIPNGTGNAFMKELGLTKKDWRIAIDIIAQAQSRSIDIGRVETATDAFYFLNMVGQGFVTDVAKSAIPFKWLGNAAYTAATLLRLVNLTAQPTVIILDGKAKAYQSVFVEVANSVFTGTTFKMAPQARLDDGLLDVVILKDISKLRLLRLFTSIYDGSHIDYPEVEYHQVKSISIHSKQPGELIPDGEIRGETPVSFRVLPQAINFLWP